MNGVLMLHTEKFIVTHAEEAEAVALRCIVHFALEISLRYIKV